VPDEILEFFQPEAEEHLQVVSDCLISLEGNNNPEEIKQTFSSHSHGQGLRAQVGLKKTGSDCSPRRGFDRTFAGWRD